MRSSTRLQTWRNRPLVFLFGPTASGKTALVESLFNTGFQIVNADSVQVYRHLDIGSAKPSRALMEKIPHHLVDIREPWQQFTVAAFIEEADRAVEAIWDDGDVPLVTGGTAYYFKHFLYGLSEAPAADLGIRAALQSELAAKGPLALHSELEKVDPVSAGRIDVHDGYRITRALEVWRQTGRPLSSFALPSEPRHGMRPLVLCISRGREELVRRIGLRTRQMFEEGLVDEVRHLFAMGADASWPAMSAIGYSEFLHARDNGCATLASIEAEPSSRPSPTSWRSTLTSLKGWQRCLRTIWHSSEESSSSILKTLPCPSDLLIDLIDAHVLNSILPCRLPEGVESIYSTVLFGYGPAACLL